jgi:hypothetical protein
MFAKVPEKVHRKIKKVTGREFGPEQVVLSTVVPQNQETPRGGMTLNKFT